MSQLEHHACLDVAMPALPVFQYALDSRGGASVLPFSTMCLIKSLVCRSPLSVPLLAAQCLLAFDCLLSISAV